MGYFKENRNLDCVNLEKKITRFSYFDRKQAVGDGW